MYHRKPMHEVFSESNKLMIETVRQLYPGLFVLQPLPQSRSLLADLREKAGRQPLPFVARRIGQRGDPSGKTPTSR